MALLFECMGKCCRNMLNTADIVRDACFRQVTRPSDLCTIFPRKNSSACQFFIDFHAFNEWRAAGGYAARVMEPATESILGVVMRKPILASLVVLSFGIISSLEGAANTFTPTGSMLTTRESQSVSCSFQTTDNAKAQND